MNNCLGCGRDCKGLFCEQCETHEDTPNVILIGDELYVETSLSEFEEESVSREEEIQEIVDDILREATES